MNLIDAALACLDRKWSIFPLQPGTKIPLTSHGFKDSSQDTGQVRLWWSITPDANIGVATGQRSNVVVVDVDVKNKAQGRKSLLLIKGLVPLTYTVTTPTGGWHLYYHHASSLKGRLGFLPGIDIKADGGYVVGPGSMIGDKTYECVTDDIFAPLSELLKKEIARPPAPPMPVVKEKSNAPANAPIVVGPNNWHKPILALVARMVHRGYSDSEILLHTDQYTMEGFSIEKTRQEVFKMIISARQKGWGK